MNVKRLIELANTLDEQGHVEKANMIDDILHKYADSIIETFAQTNGIDELNELTTTFPTWRPLKYMGKSFLCKSKSYEQYALFSKDTNDISMAAKLIGREYDKEWKRTSDKVASGDWFMITFEPHKGEQQLT